MLKSFPNNPNYFNNFYICLQYMCYRPQNLLNPSLNFHEKFDRMYNHIPCGKCGECRVNLKNSFEARVYFEYLDTEKCGGYTFFQTFTYDQAHVPKKYGILCFDPRDYRLFSENFRTYLKNFGFSGDDYKVLWVSEYGGEYFRPHHHNLTFVKTPALTPDILVQAQEYAWAHFSMKRDKNKKCLREPLGYLDTNNPDPTRRSRIQDRIVNGQGALDYVAKYVCKDFDFERMVKGQIEHQDGVSEYTGPDPDHMTTKEKNQFFPFHRQSNGLGISMKDVISYEELLNGTCKIPDKIQGTKVVSLPQYIDRKVFYDYDKESKCFKLNEKGFEMKQLRSEHNRCSVAEQLRNTFYNVQNFITPAFYKHYPHITSPSDFKIDVINLMAGRSFKQLADYIVVYKDTIDYFRDQPITDEFTDYLVLCRSVSTSNSGVCLTQMRDSGKREALHRIKQLEANTFKHRKEFQGFEEVLKLFNDLNKYFCDGQQELYIQRQVEKARQKKLYHSLYRYG